MKEGFRQVVWSLFFFFVLTNYCFLQIPMGRSVLQIPYHSFSADPFDGTVPDLSRWDEVHFLRSIPAFALHGGSFRKLSNPLAFTTGKSKGLTLFSGMNKLDFIYTKPVELRSEGEDGRI